MYICLKQKIFTLCTTEELDLSSATKSQVFSTKVFFIVLCFFIHLIPHTFAEHPGVPDTGNGVPGVVLAVKDRVVWGVNLLCSVVGLVREHGKGCGANESRAFPSAWLWTAFSRVVTELALGGTQKEKGSPDPEEQDHGRAAEGWVSGCG